MFLTSIRELRERIIEKINNAINDKHYFPVRLRVSEIIEEEYLYDALEKNELILKIKQEESYSKLKEIAGCLGI
jgi:hypothetical protein